MRAFYPVPPSGGERICVKGMVRQENVSYRADNIIPAGQPVCGGTAAHQPKLNSKFLIHRGATGQEGEKGSKGNRRRVATYPGSPRYGWGSAKLLYNLRRSGGNERVQEPDATVVMHVQPHVRTV